MISRMWNFLGIVTLSFPKYFGSPVAHTRERLDLFEGIDTVIAVPGASASRCLRWSAKRSARARIVSVGLEAP